MSKRPTPKQFIPTNPKKYKGDPRNIWARSSWEMLFMRRCDRDPNFISWSSEETIIPYFYDVDQKMHRYFVDFTVTIKDRDGNLRTYLIEVKPHAQTIQPKEKKITAKSRDKIYEWVKNQNKWHAAEKYAEQRGWVFKVLTEHELGIKKIKERSK